MLVACKHENDLSAERPMPASDPLNVLLIVLPTLCKPKPKLFGARTTGTNSYAPISVTVAKQASENPEHFLEKRSNRFSVSGWNERCRV